MAQLIETGVTVGQKLLGNEPEIDFRTPRTMLLPRWPGWRSFFLIAAFWTLYGSVMATSLFYSRAIQPDPAEVIAFSFGGAYTWALLTLPLFAFTRRFNLYGAQRGQSFVALCAMGLLLTLVVSASFSMVAAMFFPTLVAGTRDTLDGFWLSLRYRFLSDMMGCLLVFAAAVARDYFFRYQDGFEEAAELRRQLVETRLQVLRAQLNPHFLFNTLNAVAALVSKDPKGVRRMIARLSDLLRSTLEETSEPELPLRRELEVLELYFEIFEIRYQGRLTTRVVAEPELADALVPNLILQPLAENAMKHGVGLAAGYGSVEVDARKEGDFLVLRVRDTGSGDEKTGPVNQAQEVAKGGFGLRQTTERLERLYGSDFSLTLESQETGGTLVELRLPYHTTPWNRGMPKNLVERVK